MKRFIAGRVEVHLGYNFEEMDKQDAIEKCKELGPEWRLPNKKEINYICWDLAYGGSSDFWTSTGTLGGIVNRRGGYFNEPSYWVGSKDLMYDCQYAGNRCFQVTNESRKINSVFIGVRDI
jgi:hypothetical protein